MSFQYMCLSIFNSSTLSILYRFVVVDLSAGPCTYGKIETEEGSVSYKTMPRLSNLIFSKGPTVASASSTEDVFMGQLGALIATTIEYVIAPDVRYLLITSL